MTLIAVSPELIAQLNDRGYPHCHVEGNIALQVDEQSWNAFQQYIGINSESEDNV